MDKLRTIFETKCKEVYGNCNTTNYIKDEFVAIIEFDKIENKFKLDPKTNVIYNNKEKRSKEIVEYISEQPLETIAIILESPHRDEYDNDNAPLGPALGQTGKNISNHVINIFNDCKEVKDVVLTLTKTKFKILLVEAINFQCSNGFEKIDKYKRDKLFTLVWENGGFDNFKDRLREYYPIIVINSSTGGINNVEKNDYINSKVQKILNEFEFEIFHTSHPSSSWFWRKGIIKSNK